VFWVRRRGTVTGEWSNESLWRPKGTRALRRGSATKPEAFSRFPVFACLLGGWGGERTLSRPRASASSAKTKEGVGCPGVGRGPPGEKPWGPRRPTNTAKKGRPKMIRPKTKKRRGSHGEENLRPGLRGGPFPQYRIFPARDIISKKKKIAANPVLRHGTLASLPGRKGKTARRAKAHRAR